MASKLTNIEKVLKYLPASIRIAEAATSPGGKTLSGAKKKALAIGAAIATIPLPPKQKAAVGVVNDAIVAAFHIAGLFAKKTPVK
jgi:hypothetical protein